MTETEHPTSSSRSSVKVLLAIVTVLLVIGAMQLTQTVTMPLAFAIFVAMVVEPLYRRIRARLSKRLTITLVIGLVLGIMALFVWALAESLDEVADQGGGMQQRIDSISAAVDARAQQIGLDAKWKGMLSPGAGQGSKSLKSGIGAIAQLILFIGFLVLTIAELEEYRRKFRKVLNERLIGPARSLSYQFYRYLMVRTAISAVSGAFAGIYTWALGLEFALIWAILTFLLNYIPTLGTVVAVAVPSLFALVQFDDPMKALWIFMGLLLFELFMGNYIDPRLQGRTLSLSPLVVLFSMAFWGWVWGIGGALLAVPLTVAIVVACRNFPETAWIADLLMDEKEQEKPAPGVQA